MCGCDLRDRRWNTNTGRCETCQCNYKQPAQPAVDASGEDKPLEDAVLRFRVDGATFNAVCAFERVRIANTLRDQMNNVLLMLKPETPGYADLLASGAALYAKLMETPDLKDKPFTEILAYAQTLMLAATLDDVIDELLVGVPEMFGDNGDGVAQATEDDA